MSEFQISVTIGRDAQYQLSSQEQLSTLNPAFSYPEHRLVGWNTRPDESGVDYPPQSQLAPDRDVTLYAKWRNNWVNLIDVQGRSNKFHMSETSPVMQYSRFGRRVQAPYSANPNVDETSKLRAVDDESETVSALMAESFADAHNLVSARFPACRQCVPSSSNNGYQFSSCSSLTCVSMPVFVGSFDINMFMGCSSLVALNLSSGTVVCDFFQGGLPTDHDISVYVPEFLKPNYDLTYNDTVLSNLTFIGCSRNA